MARPRKPLAVAKITGATIKDPQRYRPRIEPTCLQHLGDPPDFMDSAAATAWRELAADMPWLNGSHRGILEIAAILKAKMVQQTLCTSGLNLLRLCLGQMGATPATARFASSPCDNPEDPADQYFR